LIHSPLWRHPLARPNKESIAISNFLEDSSIDSLRNIALRTSPIKLRREIFKLNILEAKQEDESSGDEEKISVLDVADTESEVSEYS
jgi:hypothetical protein